MEKDRRHRRELRAPMHRSREHRKRAKDNLQEGPKVAQPMEYRADSESKRPRVRVGFPAQVNEAEKSLHRPPQLEAQEGLRLRVKKGVAGKD